MSYRTGDPYNKSTKTKSRTSPVGGRRGCLCPDNTYDSKCCNGDLQAHGVGSLTGHNG